MSEVRYDDLMNSVASGLKKKAKVPVPGALAPNTPQPGSYLQKAPDEIYNAGDIARQKANAALSATRGANTAIASAGHMGVNNPAFGFLASRIRSGAGVQSINAGHDIETTARSANASLLLNKENAAQGAARIGIASDENSRAAQMDQIQRALQQLQLQQASTAQPGALAAIRGASTPGGPDPNRVWGNSARGNWF